MAFKKQIYEFKILLLVLIGIPLITSTNIDCGGKSFHCVDSTHFMICVDLGGGVSSTVDDFVIPCPPPTVCEGTNHFECEFPALTTPLPVPPIDITNEIGTTQQWEAISVTTTFPTNVSEEHLDLKYVDGTRVTLAGVTTDISIQTTPIFNVSESVTENNVIITTESIKESTVFTKANNGNVLNIDANTTIISLGESQTTFNQTEAYAVSGSSTIATDTTISSVMSQNPIVNETNINLEDNQTQLNITETKITADFPTIPTQTIVSAMTDNPITLATSSNIDSNVNTETNIMLDSATEISTTINEFLLPNIMDNLTTTVRIEDIYMTTSTPDSVTILSENAVNSMPVQAEIVTAPSTMGEVRTTVDPFNHISEKVSSKSIIDTTASVYESGIENDVITTTESLMYETTVFTQLIKSTNRTNTLLINVTGIDGNDASNNTVVSQINSKYAATEGIGTILTNIPGINEAPDTPTTEVIITNTQTYLKDTNYVPESVTDFGNDRPIKSTTLVSTKDILDSGVAPTTDILTTKPTELVYELSTVTASGDLTVTENVLPTISSIIVTNSNLATVGNISTGTPNPTTEAFTSITTEPTTISGLPHSEIVAMLVSTTASTSTKLNESSMADKTKILEIYETTTMASIDNKNELLTTTDNIIIPTGNTVIPQTTIISNGTTENNIMNLDNIIRNKSKQTDEVTSNPFYKGTVMSSSSSDLDQITDEAAETTIPVIKIDLNTEVTDVPAMIVTNSPDLNPIINEAVDTTKSVIKIDLNTEVIDVPAMIVTNSPDLNPIINEAVDTTKPVIKIDLNTEVTDVPAMIVTNSPDLDSITDEAVDTTKSVIKIDLNTEVTDVPATIVTNSPITIQNKTALNQTQQTEIRQPNLSSNENTTKHWSDSTVVEASTSATTAYENITEHKTVPIEITTEHSNITNISGQRFNLNETFITTTSNPKDLESSTLSLEAASHITSNVLNILENNVSSISPKVEESVTEAIKVKTENSLIQSIYDSVVNSFTKTTNNSMLTLDSLSTTTSAYGTSTKSNETSGNKIAFPVTSQIHSIDNRSEIETATSPTNKETILSTADNFRNLSQGIVATDVNLSDASTSTADKIYSSPNNLFTANPNVEILSQNSTEIILMSVPTQGKSESISTLNANGLTHTEDFILTTSMYLPENTSSKPIMKDPLEDISNLQENVTTEEISSVVSKNDLFNESSLAAIIVSPEKRNLTNERDIFIQVTLDSSSSLTVQAQVEGIDTSTAVKDLASSHDQEQYDLANKSKLSQNTIETVTWSHNSEFVTANPILKYTSQFDERRTANNLNMEYEDISHLQDNVTTEEISSVVSKNDLFNKSSLAAIIVSPEKHNLTNERDIFTQVTLDSSSSLTVQAQVAGIDTSTAVKDLSSSFDQKQYDLANKSKQSQNKFETVTRSHNSEFVTANPILKYTSQSDERGTANNLNIEYNVNNPSQNAILNNVSSIEEAVGIPLNTTEFSINKSEENRLPAENHSFITTTAQSIVRENKNVSTPDKLIILTINSDGSASYASENVSLNRPTQAVQSVITEFDDVTENQVTKNYNVISMTVKTEKSSTDNLNKDLVISQPHITPIIGTVNTVMPNEDGILMTGSNNPISSFGSISTKEVTVEIPTSLPTEQLSINEPQIVLISKPTQGEVIVTTVKPNEDGKTITGLEKPTSNKTEAESSLVKRPQMGVENSPIQGKVKEHTLRPNEDVKTITDSNKPMSSFINVQPAASKDAVNKTTSSIGFDGIASNVVESMFTSERTVPNEIHQKTTGHNVEEPQRNNTVVGTQENTETTILAKSPFYQDIILNASNDQATITELQNAKGIPALEEDNTQITSNRDIKQVTDSSIPISIASIALTGGANDKAQLKTTISSLTPNKQDIRRDFMTTITPIAGTILGWDSKLDSLATSNINNREVSTMGSFTENSYERNTENTLNGDILIHASPQKASTVKETIVQSVNKNNSHGIDATVATDKTEGLDNSTMDLQSQNEAINKTSMTLKETMMQSVNKNNSHGINATVATDNVEGLDNSTMDLQSQNEAINKTSMTVKETMLQSVNKNNSHGINATVPTDKTEGLDNSTMDLQSQNEAINNISVIGHKQVTIQQSSTNKDGSTRGYVEISTQGNLNYAKGQPVTESMNPQVKDDAKSSSIFDIITSASSYVPNVDSSTMSSDINAQITFSKSKLTHGTIRPPDNEENEKFKTSEVGQTSTQSMGTIAMVTKENKKVNNVATTTMHFNTATETLNIAQQKPLDDVTNSYVLNNINENKSNLTHTESTFIIPPRQVTNSQNADKISNAPTSQYTEVTPTKMGVTLQTEITTSRSIQKTSSKPNNTIATKITTKSLATTERSSLKPTTMTNARVNSNQQKAVTTKPNFTCKDHIRGRYSDVDNCKKFYICIGRQEPIIGLCPANTVFSEVKTQCTKNLSHCIRNNQFKCVSEGRFSDYLQQNVYYICVENRMHNFVRFKFQCQTGYYLNKTSVRCSKNPEVVNLSSSVDISKSTIEKKSKEETKSKKEEDDFECEKEGKFANENNCRRYYVCKKTNRSEEFRRRIKKCDSDEVFHKEKKKCVDAESYEC